MKNSDTIFKFKLTEALNSIERIFDISFIEYTYDATTFWDDTSRVTSGTTTIGVSTEADETLAIIQYTSTTPLPTI